MEPAMAIINCTRSVTTTPQKPERRAYSNAIATQIHTAVQRSIFSITAATEAMALITQPMTIKLYRTAKYPALNARKIAAGFPL